MAEPARFLALPDLRPLAAGSPYVVLDGPLIYRDARGWIWTVPDTTRTDLASVPRWVPGLARLLFRGPLETSAPAILHDGLYGHVALVDKSEGRFPPKRAQVTRSEADALFWEALGVAGEGRAGRWAMWAGVRVGGWVPWGSEERSASRAYVARAGEAP